MAKATVADIRKAILKELPKDGTAVGNMSLRERVAERLGAKVDEDYYLAARDELVAEGKIAKGQGRGGSVRQVTEEAPALSLEAQEIPDAAKAPRPKQATLGTLARKPGEPARAAKKNSDGAKVIAYQHDQRRLNNPDVGVVTPETDPEQPRTEWKYDPHIDPTLQFDVGRAKIESLIDDALASGDDATMRTALETLKRMGAPYLNWTGKAERTSFEVDTVSLHVHERIDPSTILAAVQKRMKQGKGEDGGTRDMFRAWFEEPLPYREEIEFYKHDRGWMNRLVAGDSLLVMNSLLQKESMAGRVQMVYIDPPYGIKYGSNFQPFVNKRDVKDRKDEDLTQEPEMIKAFRDTWELGIHSYLTYLRDRLLLAKELLSESGSVFVQISDENVHLVRNLLDDVFGTQNYVSEIIFLKTTGKGSQGLDTANDYLLWFAKNKAQVKYRPTYEPRSIIDDENLRSIKLFDGSTRKLSEDEIRGNRELPPESRVFRPNPITNQRPPAGK